MARDQAARSQRAEVEDSRSGAPCSQPTPRQQRCHDHAPPPQHTTPRGIATRGTTASADAAAPQTGGEATAVTSGTKKGRAKGGTGSVRAHAPGLQLGERGRARGIGRGAGGRALLRRALVLIARIRGRGGIGARGGVRTRMGNWIPRGGQRRRGGRGGRRRRTRRRGCARPFLGAGVGWS